MKAVGYISDITNGIINVVVPLDKPYIIDHRKITECEVDFHDGRKISPSQRKKIYATLRDISEWNGDIVDYLKDYFKEQYVNKFGSDWFSLKDTDMTTAKEYLHLIIDFCLEHSVHCRDSLLHRSEDIGRYLYACLIYKRCCICGKDAELHHVDRVGMGRNRNEIFHIGMEAQSLCREHHVEVDVIGQETFNAKYIIFGIKIDETIAKFHNLKGA